MSFEGPDGEDNHHRTQRVHGGTDDPSNISRVSIKSHRAYHYLFGNLTTVGVATLLNKLWLPLDWRVVAIGAEGFVAAMQLAYWIKAKRENKREGMDGDNI